MINENRPAVLSKIPISIPPPSRPTRRPAAHERGVARAPCPGRRTGRRHGRAPTREFSASVRPRPLTAGLPPASRERPAGRAGLPGAGHGALLLAFGRPPFAGVFGFPGHLGGLAPDKPPVRRAASKFGSPGLSRPVGGPPGGPTTARGFPRSSRGRLAAVAASFKIKRSRETRTNPSSETAATRRRPVPSSPQASSSGRAGPGSMEKGRSAEAWCSRQGTSPPRVRPGLPGPSPTRPPRTPADAAKIRRKDSPRASGALFPTPGGEKGKRTASGGAATAPEARRQPAGILSGVAPPVASEFKISRPPAAKRQPNKVSYCVIEEKNCLPTARLFGRKATRQPAGGGQNQ
jgi:hypothetical protein